jgi:hypothetical protein
MRIYTLHEPTDPSLEVVPVKEGFSWLAFLFSPVWAIWHRLWVWAIGFLAINTIVGWAMANVGLSAYSQGVVYVALALAVGWTANDLRRYNLMKRGFDETAVLLAESQEHAVELYLTAGQNDASVLHKNRAGGPW